MVRALPVRLIALIACLTGLLFAWMQQPPAQPLTVEKISDDLHVIVGSGGNVAVLTTPEGVILVDDKFERNVPEILEKVKGITDRPIRYIVNTHQHGDHTGGNAKLMESADIIAHQNARANMAKGNMPGLPRITFANETAVHLGGKEVRAYHLGRGHTNGDAIIVFPAHRVVHMGDMFVTSTPFIDYSAGGSAVAWTKTIDEVLKLDFDTVIPGHGPISKRADLAAWKKNFETVKDRLSELRKQGKARDEVAKLLRMDDLGWKPSANWEKGLSALYDELGR